MIWRQPDHVATAVLIRLPGEHFTTGEGAHARILSGSEALRKRLLESAAGFRQELLYIYVINNLSPSNLKFDYH